MGIGDVVLLPFGASFSITALTNCGRVVCIWSATCIIAVVGVSKDMLSVRYCRAINPSFCVILISLKSYICHNIEVNLAILNFGDIL